MNEDPIEEFMADRETFLVSGRVYRIRREDIPQLLELLEAYAWTFEKLYEIHGEGDPQAK